VWSPLTIVQILFLLPVWIVSAVHMILAHSHPGWMTSELKLHLYVIFPCAVY